MKNLIIGLILTFISFMSLAQENSYQLSSHILDISKGKPVNGVLIRLEKYNEQNKGWTLVEEKKTDKNGRVPDFLKSGESNLGIYKLIFYTDDYFKSNNLESFYPFIEIVFQIKNNSHYHVPITLSAFGYSTYRGN